MKFHLAAAAVALAACTPGAETASAPPAPVEPDIVAPTDAASGPAAPNTAETISSTPVPAGGPAMPAASPAPSPPAQASTPSLAAPTAAQLANGHAAYTRVCALCHGPAGQGVPNLGVALSLKEVAAIKEKVSKGQVKDADKMPPMAGMLQGTELDDVAGYVAAGLPQ